MMSGSRARRMSAYQTMDPWRVDVGATSTIIIIIIIIIISIPSVCIIAQQFIIITIFTR